MFIEKAAMLLGELRNSNTRFQLGRIMQHVGADAFTGGRGLDLAVYSRSL